MKKKKVFFSKNKSLLLIFIITISYLIFSTYLTPISDIQKTNIMKFFVENGILGAFIVSFFSNMTSVIPLPYYLFTLLLASQAPNIQYLILLTLSSAIGMTLGEVISYYIGRGTYKLISKGKEGQKMKKIKKALQEKPKLAPLFIFISAITPISDSIIIIPLGILNYSILKLIPPMFVGKLLYTSGNSVLGYYFYNRSYDYLKNPSNNFSILIMILLFSSLTLIIYTQTKKKKLKKSI